VGYRILLIDHGSGAGERLGEALGEAGHDTLGVAGVVEALVLIESRSFDAVLIDEGGAEEALTALCTRLSSLGHEKRSAVIVLADRVSRVVADPFERARRLGCDRIVDTAITAEELLALLGAMLGPAPQAPAEPARTEAIEDTNRDALSAESFRAGLSAPLLMDGGPAALVTDDDRGGDIEAHLDSLFAAGRAATAAANRPAAPAPAAGTRSSVSTEPRLPRVAPPPPRPAAAPRVSAPPKPVPAPPPTAAQTSSAPAQENVRRPPKALEQLRQPRLAVTPAAAPARRWPAVPPRIAATAAVVLVVAGGIAGFAWLRPPRSAGEAPVPKPPERQATAQLIPPSVHEAPAPELPPPAAVPSTDTTDSTASTTPASTEEPKLPAPPTLEEQPEKVDFGAPAIPVESTVTHPAPPPSPKPKPAATAKPTAKPTPPPKPMAAPPVVVAAATPTATPALTPPPPAPKPAPSEAAPSQSRPAPVAAAAVVDPTPAAIPTTAPAPAPPATAAPEVTQVPPAVLERVEPTYSAAALKKADGSAVIVLRVLVDEQGRISRVVVDQGLPGSELESAAISAVLRWRFQPATEGGTPVAGWTSARFEFKR
jgi:protein TonB